MTAAAIKQEPEALAPRTRMILSGPIAPALLRLAAPNILLMLVLMSAMSMAAMGGGIGGLAVRFSAWGRERQPALTRS